jgi:hypothetical protein
MSCMTAGRIKNRSRCCAGRRLTTVVVAAASAFTASTQPSSNKKIRLSIWAQRSQCSFSAHGTKDAIRPTARTKASARADVRI